MDRWTGIVAVPESGETDGMVSRLPTYLHPVCGRPLIWHAVSALLATEPAPELVVVVGDADLPEDLWSDLPAEVFTAGSVEAAGDLLERAAPRRVVVSGAAVVGAEALSALVAASADGWIGGADGSIAAASVLADDPRSAPALRPIGERLPSGVSTVVCDRASLAVATRRVRDSIIAQHMTAGVTFILPESCVVDVGVGIGRDTIIYPGVVIEGETTIGQETVVGPGCRIISSWVGSGVELKGWNYIAHTSVRNRAILEPYVRRGFD